jgi:hypothetical protein
MPTAYRASTIHGSVHIECRLGFETSRTRSSTVRGPTFRIPSCRINALDNRHTFRSVITLLCYISNYWNPTPASGLSTLLPADPTVGLRFRAEPCSVLHPLFPIVYRIPCIHRRPRSSIPRTNPLSPATSDPVPDHEAAYPSPHCLANHVVRLLHVITIIQRQCTSSEWNRSE